MWGPGKEMMKAYEKNRQQLNKRNSLKENLDFSSKSSTPINMKKVSAQELESIKQKFLEKRKKENRKSILIVFTITVFVILLGYYFLN